MPDFIDTLSIRLAFFLQTNYAVHDPDAADIARFLRRQDADSILQTDHIVALLGNKDALRYFSSDEKAYLLTRPGVADSLDSGTLADFLCNADIVDCLEVADIVGFLRDPHVADLLPDKTVYDILLLPNVIYMLTDTERADFFAYLSRSDTLRAVDKLALLRDASINESVSAAEKVDFFRSPNILANMTRDDMTCFFYDDDIATRLTTDEMVDLFRRSAVGVNLNMEERVDFLTRSGVIDMLSAGEITQLLHKSAYLLTHLDDDTTFPSTYRFLYNLSPQGSGDSGIKAPSRIVTNKETKNGITSVTFKNQDSLKSEDEFYYINADAAVIDHDLHTQGNIYIVGFETDHNHVITFSGWESVLDMSHSARPAEPFQSLRSLMEEADGGKSVVIDFGMDYHTITLQDVQKSDLDHADFVFV